MTGEEAACQICERIWKEEESRSGEAISRRPRQKLVLEGAWREIGSEKAQVREESLGRTQHRGDCVCPKLGSTVYASQIE